MRLLLTLVTTSLLLLRLASTSLAPRMSARDMIQEAGQTDLGLRCVQPHVQCLM